MSRLRGWLGLAVIFAGTTGSHARDSMELAMQLGSVLAAEEPCRLSFKQPAIEAFIEKKVAADDLDFPSSLSMMTTGAAYRLKEMSPSERTAHCTQIRRLAKSYKFID